MVQPADGNGELVADFPSHSPLLGKLDVMGIRRGSAADQAGLRSHELQVFAVALAHRFADDGNVCSPGSACEWLIVSAICCLMLRCVWLKFTELAQRGCKGVLERLGIRRHELVFEGKSPERPVGKSSRIY